MKKVPTIILSVSYKGVKFIDATNKVGTAPLRGLGTGFSPEYVISRPLLPIVTNMLHVSHSPLPELPAP